MLISLLVLELTIFFMGDWSAEIRKSEIPRSEFCPISEDWDKLAMPNLLRMSLMKFYWMLQNARVIAFTVSELLRENKQGGWGKITPSTTRLRLKMLGHAHQYWQYHLVGNFDTQRVEINLQETLMFICMEKNKFISNFFLGIVKALQTCYFGNFGNAWPSPSKIIVSICRKLPCLSACKKSTWSLTSFWKYCKLVTLGSLSMSGHTHLKR